MGFAIVLLLILLGSIIFHFVSPWKATPLASNWSNIDDALTITAAICGVFFVAIVLFMAYVLIRYRHREGHKASFDPDNKKLEWWLTIVTSIGICGMLAPGLFAYNDFIHPPEEATDIEIVGQQWQWSYRLPGEDGELGQADIRFISADNPLGISPDDVKGQDDVVVQYAALHLPVDQPVRVLMRSKDVLHNFYIPQFRAKMDMVPGQVSYMWFTPTKVGEFDVLCAELCGVGHSQMRGKVIVESRADYEQWLAQQRVFASKGSNDNLVDQGKQLAENRGCIACHSVDGSKSLGPGWKSLVGNTERLTDGSDQIVDKAYFIESIIDPKAKMVEGYPPVMVAYDFTEQQLAALYAYAASLSDKNPEPASAPQTSTGDKGRQLLNSLGCLACHSDDGSRRVGPTLKDLYGREETLADGTKVFVDADYIRESIVEPNKKIVAGFAAVMQPYPLSDSELEALVEASRQLSKHKDAGGNN